MEGEGVSEVGTSVTGGIRASTWVLATKLGSSGRAASPLTTELSLQQVYVIFNSMTIFIFTSYTHPCEKKNKKIKRCH